jgi:hypothetical protein
MLFADLVANDATDRRATDRAGGAATGQDGTAHGTNTGANRSIFILLRHACTPSQTGQQDYCCHIHHQFSYRVHLKYLRVKYPMPEKPIIVNLSRY